MKAITVEPKKPGSVQYEDIPEPDIREGSVLVEAIAAAVCGTDVETTAQIVTYQTRFLLRNR